MKTKVLIIRFSSIGDIVLTTPVIRGIKKQMDGGAEVHYLTKKAFAGILEPNPYIDKVHTLEEKVSEVLPALQEEGFDYVIDLHNNLRSRMVRNGMKALYFTFPKLNVQKWILVNFKVDRMPDVHIVDRYLEAVKMFDIQNDGEGLDYFVPPEMEVSLEELPPAHQKGYVAYAIGGNHATKTVPTNKMISICKAIQYPVLLLGGKEDVEKANQVVAAAGAHVFSVAGKYKLEQSASLVKQAKRVLTHDTGLMHIAAAFRQHIVSLWGNTVPQLGMYPHLPKGKGVSHIIQVEGLSCRPCSKLGFDKCPKKHFNCMQLIKEEEVVAALDLGSLSIVN